MPKSPSESTNKVATELSKKTFRGKDVVLAKTVRSAEAKDGRTLHRFMTHDTKKPNGARHIVILDDDGKEVDPTGLSVSESRALGIEVPSAVVGRPIATLAASASIDPKSNDLVLELGEVEDEIVTVTIPPNTGVSKADIYLLADTTGSMRSVVAAVKAGANAILSGVPGGVDVAFGAGNYRDLPATNPPFTHQLAPDTNPANVAAAIGTWSAAGGGDTPEGQLFALHRLAEAPNPIGWRPGAKRIIVWFGDAPGHDPICSAISGLAKDISEASVTKDLEDQDITVLAISTNTGVSGALDGDPTVGNDYIPTCSVGGSPRQATRIADATDGKHLSGIDAKDIVETIIDLIESAVLDINQVTLEPTGAIAPFVESISPASYGPLPGDEEHVLPFEVRWRGVKPCGDEDVVVTGGLHAVADGTVITRKPVRITIPACPPEFVYAVKYLCGTAEDCGCKEAPVRPGRYATDINLHNPSRHTARVTTSATPLVSAGIGVGRDPRTSRPASRKVVKLASHEATMDDCQRLVELHYGAPAEGKLPLTIGFLEIVSTQQLVVTAVYTATGVEGGLNIDVETVQPIVRPQLPPRKFITSPS